MQSSAYKTELKSLFLLLANAFLIALFGNAPGVALAQNSPAPYSHIKNCDICSEMIALPAGTYSMGATQDEFKGVMNKYRYMYVGETPLHQETVNAFWLARFDVTRKQFKIFAKETGFQGKGCMVILGNDFADNPNANWENPGFKQTDEDPVVCISWSDAHKFIDWLNGKLSKTHSVTYRLPTEVEWEYAARAGTTTATYWGDDRRNQCKYENALDSSARILGLHAIDHGVDCTDGYVETSPVGSFRANPWEFFDMLGNVFEWMEDCPDIGYATPPSTPPRSNTRICRNLGALRGASWASVPMMVRAGFRAGLDISSRQSTLGFRLAADTKN